jgi:hypothetical protein
MIQALTLAAIEAGLVDAGLASAAEVTALRSGLAQLIARDDIVISTARVVQASARRPR